MFLAFIRLFIMILDFLKLGTIATANNFERKFVRLIAPLDEPRGLCVDIPG